MKKNEEIAFAETYRLPMRIPDLRGQLKRVLESTTEETLENAQKALQASYGCLGGSEISANGGVMLRSSVIAARSGKPVGLDVRAGFSGLEWKVIEWGRSCFKEV